MSPRGATKLVHLESVARALEALDVDALVAAYSAEFVFEDTAAGLSITDREALRGYFEGLFSTPAVAFSDIVMFADDDGRGGGEWVWSGVGADGSPFTVKGASIFSIDDTGIKRETIYYHPPNAVSPS